MVTDTTLTHAIAPSSSPTRGTLSRAADRVNQFFCGLHGHDMMVLHVDRGRMSLHCVSCGYDTPGWDLKSKRAA
jgi:hypothetical protein